MVEEVILLGSGAIKLENLTTAVSNLQHDLEHSRIDSIYPVEYYTYSHVMVF